MKLKKFVATSGGQFNADKNGPVVIDFSKSKMIGVTGDQEVGKSTILELFLMACGQNGGDEVVKRLKNKDSDSIDLELSFVGKDKSNYDVRVKNGRITVKKEGAVTTGGPVQLLKDQLGVVGISPMAIKNEPIEKIVKWLAGYSTRSAEEFEKDMKKLKDGIKAAKKSRSDANRSLKGLREYLSGEGIVDGSGQLIEKSWKEKEAKYKTKVNVDEVSARLDAAGKKSDKFVENETKVKGQKDRKAQIEQQIAQLQEELATVDKNISLGTDWLSKNASAKKDYDAVREEYDNISKEVVAYDKWQDIKRKKNEMDEFEDLSISADSKEKEFIKKQQELQWEVIPDIKGVTLVLEDSHEDEGEQTKAGFYYKGLNSAQLSNSEWFGLVMQILKKNKIEVLVVDDISQFGSKFVETLEGLVKAGCHVLYTEMSRGQETLEIEYK